jgi:N-acyl-D-aspartate/D-glutamate deacylase
MTYDQKRNIVDGTGAPKRKGDIAVRDGRIVRMGRVADREPGTIGARRVIDGTAESRPLGSSMVP